MEKWLSRANRRISLPSAAALLIAASLIGLILGFVRTQIINGSFNYGTNVATDPYFAAFKIPDFFFYTIAAGALGVAFMPFLTDRLQKGDRKTVWHLTSSLLNLLSGLMVIVGFALLLFPGFFIRIVIGHNLGPHETHQAIVIMRLIAFNPLLFTISGILSALQQTFGRFFFYALAPILYNGSIIASAYIFRAHLGLVGLGIGALAGAILQLLFVLLGLVGMGYRWTPVIAWHSTEFKQILRNLPPRSIDQGIYSINSIVETNRASTLPSGSITFYENAYTLHLAPILLIGTTIATAAFPRLNERLSQGRPDLFRRDFLRVFRAIFWIILPVAIITFFARAYLARLIYKSPEPTIALVLGFLVGAVVFRTLYAIISRYFYSQKDTRTPLYVSLFTIALNIFLAFTLSHIYGIVGLAIAQSIVATVEVFILMIIMVWRDHQIFTPEFWSDITRSLSVTGFTAVTAYTMVKIVPLYATDRGFITLGSKLVLIVIPTLAVHVAISWLFSLEEVQPVIDKLKKIIFRPVRAIE